MIFLMDRVRERIDWLGVRVVGLDLMDTLLRDPFRTAMAELAELTGLPPERLSAERDPDAFHEFELGLIDEHEYGRRFFRDGSGLTLDLAALWRALEDRFEFLDGMEELAASLSARVPVHVMSNYSPWYERLRTRFRLDRFVSEHHPSFLVGARKPDPAYYRTVLDRAGLSPKELLFVDDRTVNVEAARREGLPALRFTGAADLESRIGPLLDRPPRG